MYVQHIIKLVYGSILMSTRINLNRWRFIHPTLILTYNTSEGSNLGGKCYHILKLILLYIRRKQHLQFWCLKDNKCLGTQSNLQAFDQNKNNLTTGESAWHHKYNEIWKRNAISYQMWTNFISHTILKGLFQRQQLHYNTYIQNESKIFDIWCYMIIDE